MAEKQALTIAFAHAAAAFAQTPLPYLVGMGVMLAANHWDGHLQNQKGCTEVQQVAGKFFKVDTCNGKIEAIPEAPELQGASKASSVASTSNATEPSKPLQLPSNR